MGIHALAIGPGPLTLLVVVAILLVLSLIMWRRSRAAVDAPTRDIAAPESVPATPLATAAEDVSGDELIAVIAAAIAAYGASQSGGRLVVRSVKRASAWRQAGLQEQLLNRL